MRVGFEQQLDAVGLIRADNGEPAELPERDIGLGDEPSFSIWKARAFALSSTSTLARLILGMKFSLDRHRILL